MNAAVLPSSPETPPGTPYGTSAPSPREVRGWDVALTTVELVLLGVLVVVWSFLSWLLVGLTCATDSSSCAAVDVDALAIGLALVPWAGLVLAVAGSVVLLVRRHLAFWCPWAALVVTAGVWLLGVAWAVPG